MHVPEYHSAILNIEFNSHKGRTQQEHCWGIEKAWHDLGHFGVKAWLEDIAKPLPREIVPQKMRDHTPTKKICSNLVNGLPPRKNLIDNLTA